MKKFAVFEREPKKNPEPNKIVLGLYSSEDEANRDMIRYGFVDDNYYVAQVAPNMIDPAYE